MSPRAHPDLLVGFEGMDDCAVFRLSEDLALVQTVDFFTPIVDDPYDFGQIAACNALSDVYAMGARPILALNVVAFPEELVEEVLPEVMRGSLDKLSEAGVLLCGGHTIRTREPIYGLCVAGTVHPDRVIRNAGARPGDLLLLTKPLGTGVIATAVKAELAEEAHAEAAISSMKRLNRRASELAAEVGVSAMTDVTGFGLLGHLFEMALGSGVRARVRASDVPLLPGALEYAGMGLMPEGLHANRRHLSGKFHAGGEVDELVLDLLFDPQTSGGLLMAAPPERAEEIRGRLLTEGEEAYIIGLVLEADGEGPAIEVL